MAALILAYIIIPQVLHRISIKTFLNIGFLLIIIFAIPLIYLDVGEEFQVYLMLSIFIASIGLGICANLTFVTGSAILPAMMTTEAFSFANIIGPIVTMLSP